MPQSAVAAGCVDLVLSPENIAKELARIARHPYVAGQPTGSLAPAEDDRTDATAHADDATPLPSGGRGTPQTGAQETRAEAERGRRERAVVPGAENGFKKVLLLLRNHSGVDFSLYKSTTIQRRITWRMVLNKEDTLERYAHFLRGNAGELDALYSDALISVTGFFRNPEAFDVLKRTVFPKLLQRRGDESFRAWVLGCSTGQEAYSIAMAFVEAAENAPRMPKLQVFATDLNDALLDKARHGLYAKGLADDVSLRAAINQAKKENKAARRENVRVEHNGKTVNVEVIPLKNMRERCFLIVFEEAGQVGEAGDGSPLAIEPRGAVRTPRPGRKESRRVADLEREVSEMRDYLQSIQEQYEATLTVGTSVTRSPPHRPGRAVFPHPAPRLYSLSRRTRYSRTHHVLPLNPTIRG